MRPRRRFYAANARNCSASDPLASGRTCPLRSMCTSSMPARVARAVRGLRSGEGKAFNASIVRRIEEKYELKPRYARLREATRDNEIETLAVRVY